MITRGAVVAVFWLAVVVSSCSGSFVVAPVQLSSAQMVAAGSPDLRTLDNTGFVYPGGHTTEVSQGIAPAVVGRGAYLTAPPSHLVPLPLAFTFGSRPKEPRAVAGVAPSETVGRVARALCDQEMTCERIGPDGVFESADACSTEQRARLGDLIAKDGCETTVRGDLLAACLREIRAAPCLANLDAFSMPPPCGQALPPC